MSPVMSFNRSTILFVTVCTKGRMPCLAQDAAHAILVSAWSRAEAWQIGRYIIMPDHIHFFCAPGSTGYWPLQTWVRFWKREAAIGLKQRVQGFRWQRGFWDTQMRTGRGYAAKWQYVRMNPVRHGLVSSPDHWPYSGEMHTLWWHD
jgi:REP element-mobilizing transposase RayT